MGSSTFNHFMSNFKVIFNYLKSDIIKKQRSFKIGLFTIFLVVLFISLLMNMINIAPVIFLRLSEDQAGESDIMMLPFLNNQDASKKLNAFDTLIYGEKKNNSEVKNRGSIKLPGDYEIQFLNFTDLHSQLKDEPYIHGLAPRWVLQGNTTFSSQEGDTWALANLLIMNTKLENKYGLGRKFQIDQLGPHECYVSDSLYKNLKLNPNFHNDTIILRINPVSIMKAIPGLDKIVKAPKEEDEDYSSERNQFAANSQRYKNRIDFNANYVRDLISKKINISKESITEQPQEGEVKKFLRNTKFIKSFDDFEIKIPIAELNAFGFNPSDLEVIKYFLENELTKNLSLSKILSILKIFEKFNKGDEQKDDEFMSQDNKDSRILQDDNKDYFTVKLNLTRILFSIPDETLDEMLTLKVTLKIKEVIDSDSGKWTSALGNVLALDSNFASDQIADTITDAALNIIHYFFNRTSFDKPIEKYIHDSFKGFHFDQYTLTVNVLLKDKFNIYSDTSANQRRRLSTLTEKIIGKIGFDYPVRMELPLYEAFKSLEIVKLFLQNIFQSVMFFLWILCTMLIYSLMLGNVDEKNYEFGMLRALGYKKSNLISMILMQALFFSVPAIILALSACYILNVLLGYLLFLFSGLIMDYNLQTGTIIWSIAAGISIPLASSYFPIKKALSENLKEALSIFNKKIGDISVSIVKLEKLGISPASLLSSILFILMGFATYYLAPLSFLISNYSIFLTILNSILIIMIIGLIFMLQLLVPKLQTFVLSLLMLVFYKDQNVKFIVQKNLDGHSRRNQKTSIMFMIALSFIIFAGCTLRLVGGFITSASKNVFGGNIWLFNNAEEDTLNQNQLNMYIDEFNKQFPHSVKNYSYISYNLKKILGFKTKFSTLCGFPDKDIDLISVDTYLISSGFSELYMVSEYDKSLNFTYSREFNNVDLITGLYLNNNTKPILQNKEKRILFPPFKRDIEEKQSLDDSYNIGRGFGVNFTQPEEILLVIPEGLRRKFTVDLVNPGNIQLHKQMIENYPARIIGLAIKIPGVPAYSSYSTISYFAPVITSNHDMKKIIDREMALDPALYNKMISRPAYTNTPDNIRKQILIIRFYDDVPLKTRETLFFGIKNFRDNDNTRIIFVDMLVDSGKKASDIMEYFFLVIGMIALILSFFLVWTSFYCNIKDNICEFGIMRAIGISKRQATRVFLYEAAVLILSSIIVGTFIGVVISTTLVLQFNLFSELPFESNFPFKLYFIMCLTGFFLGLLGSYYPTHQVNKVSLVKILKGIMD